MRIRHLLPTLMLLLLLLPADPAAGQRTFGVQWEVPTDQTVALQELAVFKRLGVEIVEVDRPLSNELWSALEDQEIRVYASIPIHYPTWRTFAEPDSAFVATLRDYLNHFIPRADGIRLFSFGAVHDERLLHSLVPYLDQIRDLFEGRVYNLQNHAGQDLPVLDFTMERIRVRRNSSPQTPPEISTDAGAWLYDPEPDLFPYLSPLKSLLDATAQRPGTPLFVTGEWLFDKLERFPSFAETFRLYATTPDPVFPLPEESLPGAESFGLGVLLLLIVWGSSALHYSMSPLYRRSIGRFFTSHKFFTSDVLHRHVRASVMATVMLLQHALLSGILVYGIGRHLFSETGAGALMHHFTWLNLTGNFHLSLFTWGFVFSLALEMVSILWILICNTKVRFMSQVTNLYIWPLQLNLITVTLLFALLISGRAGVFTVSLLTGCFLLTLFGAFMVTAFDTSRLLGGKRFWFLTGTAGVHSLLLAVLFGWLFLYTDILTILSLALHL